MDDADAYNCILKNIEEYVLLYKKEKKEKDSTFIHYSQPLSFY
jgi:hypothetical protein